MYDGRKFSNLAPTRFSFDFLVPSPIRDGLILLYGKNLPSINDFFWIAIEIFESKLQFYFRDTKINVIETIDPSTWYHVECQVSNKFFILKKKLHAFSSLFNQQFLFQ